MLPKIDLPDLLFEVHFWTGFLDVFVHLGDGTTRMKDLATSLVALLVSEACNIGLTPVVNPAHEALTRARLVHVDQYYLRADTITAANAKLIEAQAQVPIVQFWGNGLLASVDGLRFVVPVRTISSAPSPKYFGFKRGITWLNAVNDQVAGIGQMVVPGTPHDSLHILDALLNLDGGVKPEMGREGRPTPLGAAFAEYGRIAKTEHLLRVVDPVDDTYRRQMNRQLTVQESRHQLARDVCHGKRGTIHQAYRDGMEDQLGALGLALNAIVLWTTKYIDAAVEQLHPEGHEIREEDIARLSPLKHRNLNLLGRYSFTASTPAAGALRPLRDPDAPELDEDEDGQR
ncbi:Tn3 family transposase [Streptomyces rhizosphaericus]